MELLVLTFHLYVFGFQLQFGISEISVSRALIAAKLLCSIHGSQTT